MNDFIEVSKESIDILESNLQRAVVLIRSFKQIAVDQSDEYIRDVGLRSYVEEVLMSLKPKYKNRPINIEVDIDPGLSVHQNPGALSQIITNMVLNSITHGYEFDSTGYIRISGVARGDMVSLDYRDNGKGMDEGSVRKVFEPFFTTRRGEGGSGLGMHVVYNLVTQSLDGAITCKSVLGEGVHINIVFPKRRGKAAV
jgi:signal transduction histidine kinase